MWLIFWKVCRESPIKNSPVIFTKGNSCITLLAACDRFKESFMELVIYHNAVDLLLEKTVMQKKKTGIPERPGTAIRSRCRLPIPR